MHDSGYTSKQVDALIGEFLAAADPAAFPDDPGFCIGLALGLLDGDRQAISPKGTVLLTATRAEIDANIAAVRAALAAGSTLRDALDALPDIESADGPPD